MRFHFATAPFFAVRKYNLKKQPAGHGYNARLLLFGYSHVIVVFFSPTVTIHDGRKTYLSL